MQIAVAIDTVTGRPRPWLYIGPVIGHMRAMPLSSLRWSVVSTTARLTVDLATAGRTMMEASLAWPDSFSRRLATRD